jgi:hypothetical protein
MARADMIVGLMNIVAEMLCGMGANKADENADENAVCPVE